MKVDPTGLDLLGPFVKLYCFVVYLNVLKVVWFQQHPFLSLWAVLLGSCGPKIVSYFFDFPKKNNVRFRCIRCIRLILNPLWQVYVIQMGAFGAEPQKGS